LFGAQAVSGKITPLTPALVKNPTPFNTIVPASPSTPVASFLVSEPPASRIPAPPPPASPLAEPSNPAAPPALTVPAAPPLVFAPPVADGPLVEPAPPLPVLAALEDPVVVALELDRPAAPPAPVTDETGNGSPGATSLPQLAESAASITANAGRSEEDLLISKDDQV